MIKKIALLLTVVFFLGVSSISGLAAITLDAGFTGTFLITSPTGDITFVGTGEPLPPIPSGSSITVLEGQATIHPESGETLNLSLLGFEGSTTGPATVSVACDKDSQSCTLKILQGSLTLVDQKGQVTTLAEGSEHLIQAEKGETAPATAAGEVPGGSTAPGALGSEPPVDGRNLQTSPT